MRKYLFLIPVALLLGCASFSDNVFRTEQAAVNVAYGSYIAYTSSLPVLKISAEQSNAVKTARLQFAASVGVLDSWRVAYETNALVKPQVQAALSATVSQSSNLVWVIAYILKGTTP